MINPNTEEAYDLLHRGTLALARAEQQGIRVDLEYIEKKQVFLTLKIEHLEKKFKLTKFYVHWVHSTKGKVNINSNNQLAHFLYGIKKIKPEKLTVTGQGSTDDEALQMLNLEELNILLEMRKLRKIRDTYLVAFSREQVNGYIHPFFNLHIVKTYRSSSDKPNFQNIPKRDEEAMNIVRQALYPRPGHQLIEVDFSGMEVRINCCYNKDSNLIHYMTNKSADMHADMAKEIFLLDPFDKKIPEHYVLRQAAKNGFVFPEFYGDYFGNCSVNMANGWGKLPRGIWSPGQGIPLNGSYLSDHLISKGINSLAAFTLHLKRIEHDFWYKKFPDYSTWKERWWSVYQKYGYIDLLTGFRCSGVMTKNEVINTPAQGTAFHCLLWSFNQLDEIMIQENWDTRLIGQIHDSIILDVNPTERDHVIEVVKKVTTEDLPAHWKWINVPMEIDIDICKVDGSWIEKSSIN
jgi:DNA polymerase I-like protein with 3'-5' exonuclease and polymerase domains